MYKQNIFSTLLIGTIVVIVSNVSGQFSKATLHPNCLKIQPTNHLSRDWGTRLFAGAHFYIPFGSSQAINHITKLTSSGSKANNNKNEKNITINTCIIVNIRGFTLRMDNKEGNFMIQECAVIKKGMNDCKIKSLSENPEYQKNGDAIVIIVWTDNKTSMAIVRCSADGLYNDWYVFSTLPSLNATMKDGILSAVSKLGFPHKLENTLSPSYEGCELFPPEEDDD